MTQFATMGGERTIRTLARKLYDARDNETLDRVEKALADANPALADIGKLDVGTPVEVPDVRGVEFTPASGSLSDLARTSGLHSLRESLPDLTETLRDTLNEQVSARRAELRSVDSADVKRVARDDKGVTARLGEARVQADVTLQQAIALRDEAPKALEELNGDLDDLLERRDRMATYVQAAGSDTWHWCKNCSHYPSSPAKTQTTRPSWDLCEQCKAKEKNGTCST